MKARFDLNEGKRLVDIGICEKDGRCMIYINSINRDDQRLAEWYITDPSSEAISFVKSCIEQIENEDLLISRIDKGLVILLLPDCIENWYRCTNGSEDRLIVELLKLMEEKINENQCN